MAAERQLSPLERAAEKRTGRTVEYLRGAPMEVIRADAENRLGPMKVTPESPYIITHEQANEMLTKALGK